MGWAGGAGRRGRAHEPGERRLMAIARQWRSTSNAAPPGSGSTHVAPPPDDPRWPLREAGPWAASARGWTRSAARGLALLVAVAVALAGYWAWSGRPRAVAMAPQVIATGVAVTGIPASTPVPTAGPSAAAAEPAATGVQKAAATVATAAPVVVVHVTGLVANPGLVELPLGSRVADAVSAAGGVTRRRAADTVNLARVLVDGEQIVVGGAVTAAGPPATATTPLVLELNSATEASLQELPGIGPVIAARIVAWRSVHGPFRSVDELGEVSGIGDAILAQLRPLVRV